MDWQAILTNLGITGAGLAIAAPLVKRWLVQNMASNTADFQARAIQKETIDFLKEQLRDRDERISALQAAHLESRRAMDREIRVFRSTTRSMANDIRLVNDGRVPEERFETQIHVTGMGPLDP